MKWTRLFPWFNEKEDDLRTQRTDEAVDRGKEVEAKLRRLAESYRAAGIIVREVHRPAERLR